LRPVLLLLGAFFGLWERDPNLLIYIQADT